MALQVWLPLNGNLNNQGLASVTVTVSGTTAYTTGKIGQGLSGNGSSFWTITGVTLGAEASIACWSKTSANGRMQWVLTSTASDRLNLYESDIYTLNIGDGNNNPFKDGSGNTITCLHDNQWHHFVVTFGSSTAKLYIDGVYRGTAGTFRNPTTTNDKIIRLGGGYGGGHSYDWNGVLNDFRVYDHCLSAMEVKELSKGLVLHYPLSDVANDANKNLVPSNYWSGTKTLSLSANTTSYGFINYPTISVKTNTTYLWKLELRIISGGNNLTSVGIDTNCSGGSYSGNDSAHTVVRVSNPNLAALKTGEWQTAYCITTVKSDATNPSIFHAIYGASSAATSLTVEYRNLMLVEATDVVPLRMWYSNTVYDCSGFCNNGTLITDTITTSTDTAKYQVSTYFNGTYDGILIENLQLSDIINSAVTYAFWIKPEGESGARSVYFGSYSGSSWSIEKTAGNVLRSYWNGSPDETCSGATITDGIWQHVCLTKTGTNDIKVYINGVQKWASTATHSNLTFPTTYRIGRDVRTNDGTPYKGLMSDFRIYATALSANDVKSLYQNSAYVDASGNVYGIIR